MENRIKISDFVKLSGSTLYFKTHPQQYQAALEYGDRLAKLAQLPEDDPEIEALARESAEFIKNISTLRELLCGQTGFTKSFEKLHNDMVCGILSPAQMKHKQLIQQYLNFKSK